MGRVTKVAKETLKLVDLTRAKLWVEMLPNVVLPALLEVEDGEWSYTVAVSVTGEDEDADAVTSDPKVRAQSGMRHRGLQDGPDAPQAHQSASASSLSPQRAASSTKASRRSVQTVQGPAPRFSLEKKEERSPLVWKSGREGKKSKRGRGKPRGSHERCYAGGRDAISKKTWSTLFPPSAIDDRDIGAAVSLFSHGMSLSGNLSKEDTSASRVEVKGGLTGRVGFDPRGYSDMGSPSNSIIRGKGLIFEGFCEIPGAKNLESGFSFDESLWSNSSQFSPSSSVSYGKPRHLKNFYEKGGVDYLNHGDIPDRVEEENQCALSNQMSESCTPKDSIVRSHKEVSGDFLIDGCPPGKWPKCERYYALLTLRCILGGRAEAPQGIETCWFWLGRLGSLCFPMKIISWNVRGLGSRNKRRMVKDFLRSENPDVVMIQETKKENCDRRFVGSVWTVRNKDWVALPASGASGGILIIWDSKNLSREEVVIGSFSVSVKFSLDGCGPLWISAVYGPNSPSLRKDFWVELFDIYGLTYPLWCVGGDFNVIRRSSEKMGGSSLTPSMRDFDSFIRECELLDPPLRNASFTWSNMQESPVCKRLDRFLYSNEWGLLFPQGLQEALIRRTSDHWPIVMDTNPFMWGPTPFRFENMWLQHTNFKENFRDWWSGFQGNGWEGHKFMRRLQYVKAKLKEWNKFSFGELKEKKKSILNDLANFDAIEQEGGLNPDLLSQRASRKGELEELILREEIHWRQKAKVKWVKEGDCNSKFYHKVANGRRNRKYIKELENERGLVLKNAESITEEILHYFEKLYTNPTGESWGVEGLDWSPISEESALRDKAPGPDGFTIAVFQECWDVIKEDLVRVFAEFHRSGIINQSTNASFIVLIPKKSLSKRISDFRPISLITSLYKIIAKVLSGRLRGVLHETIHYTQGAFVQGRQILDAVLIANEIVDERRRKEGFSPRWRKWMSGCLSSVSYAILVNGSAKGWVKASRGLRQGDPLSPFLFTLVADVLSRMLMRAEERNMMEGFRVGRNRTRVSHLQFADDTIFFSNSREEELQTLKSLLLVFGHISGLKVNLNKSSIYGINLDQAHLSRLAEMLDCKASGWPILYLGLPLGGNPKACGFWDPVVERISSRLDGWQKAYLSFGGRITLIQSCLTHLPSYFLSLFKIPASVAAKIERLQRDFLWSGVGEGKRDHLVRWDVVCKPKTIGGLGLGNISWRNLALLGKWLWSQMVTSLSLEGYCSSLSGFSLITRYVVGNGEEFVLGPSRPFLWNLNFRRNLSDSEIEDLEGLMRSLDDLYLSPSVPDARLWPLSSSGLFSVKSFFLALSQSSGSSQNFPSKFVWNSQVPFKVKSFVCTGNQQIIFSSLFLDDWVVAQRGIVLWQAASIALIRVVWWERNARIFEDKARNSEFLWDSIVFLASLWAFCSKAFKGIPLNVIQLDWIAVPWIQVSRSRSLLLMVKPAVFLVAIGMGTVLHLVLLAFNALSIQSLSAVSGGSKSPFAKRQNTVAFLLVASQKTLPVMVAVVEQLHGTLGESGLLVLPCVAAHLNQGRTSDNAKRPKCLTRPGQPMVFTSSFLVEFRGILIVKQGKPVPKGMTDNGEERVNVPIEAIGCT
ncbi:LINE-1 retrotransposable element ORF2 protein [Vitis vinifera]|uniref:LINE-1 retrotransposable element ORF2 protein n=1 Tax=Vitis vinifera TaxID=29760 RepID=A0A438IBZ1_VITVI|nr:LINE-1 retrotransposable element ORF2 protein [Vitis vinifera]